MFATQHGGNVDWHHWQRKLLKAEGTQKDFSVAII